AICHQRSPNRLSCTRLALALTAAVATFAVCGCKKAAPAPPPPPIVQVMDIATTNAPSSIEFIGQLDSPQNVEVRARVEAFVDQMLFIEGTNVNAGDPLFKLDDRPYKEKLDAAKGSLGEAEAALAKYRTDVARYQPLAEKRAVPKQVLDNALASVDVGKAAVFSAQARVESAVLDLGYCDVRAPISGLIGAKQVSIGELVGKGSPTLLATISTLDPIWFYCNVSEDQYLRAQTVDRRAGMKLEELPITLILANGTEHPDKGKIVFLDRAVDAKTGTLRVRAAFPNPDKLLRPGMFARIKVDLGVRRDSILVPERAVAELQGKNFVWVIGADNKAAQRPVKVGEQADQGLLILEGLKAGERIVVEGLQKLREGALVQPRTAAQMAEAAAAQAAQPAEAKHGKE
ncbi:MAG TPA: efflux RND transporter periplasmic adaptor subunit, partial [Steroidobacteraceae bacterium]|nr:efflux RND transporter periplasmic adaptor subunit [Steroidobacteraceae bacterium]